MTEKFKKSNVLEFGRLFFDGTYTIYLNLCFT